MEQVLKDLPFLLNMCKKLLILIFLFAAFTLSYADLQSAVDSLKLEIEKTPDDYKLHFDLGLCYAALGEYENALEAFNSTLELNKDHTQAKYKIAIIYYYMDSLKTARDKFEDLLETDPNRESAYRYLGSIYGSLAEYEKMLDIYKTYDKRKEKTYSFTHECGIACAFLGKYEESINNYQKAIKQYRHPYGLDIELAMLYQKVGDSLKAEKWFNKSFEDLSAACGYYGRKLKRDVLLSYKSPRYYRLGKFDNAIAIIDTLIQLKKDDYVDIYNLGVFRIASGDVDGLEDIKNACDIDTTGFVQAVYNAITAIKLDSLQKAEMFLKQKIGDLRRSGIAKGLLAKT
ncbi:Photosystem I assembly protein Ycf3 [subsurface metagenome]